MKKYKLKEVASLFSGYPFDGHKYSDDGIRVVRGDNVTVGELRWDIEKRWSYPFIEEKKYSLKHEDIVIGMDGSRVGRNRAMVLECDLPLYLAQRVACVRHNDNSDQKFLYYSLLTKRFEQYVKTIHTGTSIPHISLEQIENFSFLVPNIKEQQKIGNILFDIDQKISLNTLMNAELEAMAKQLYDYWFVQFDFPNENGKPYKSSGGKMVYNEKLKREIPEGWEVQTVNDCVKHVNTGLNPRQNFKLGNGTIKYLTVKNLRSDGTIDFSNCDVIDEEAREKVHKRSDIQVGDILFASIAPLGRCHIIMNEPNEWDINESVFSIRPKKDFISPFYLYIYFTSKWFVQKAEKESAGSIFAGLRVKSLLDIPIIVPPVQLSISFDKQLHSVFKKKDDLTFENNHLTHLRDSLLPMLMNGQVTVE